MIVYIFDRIKIAFALFKCINLNALPFRIVNQACASSHFLLSSVGYIFNPSGPVLTKLFRIRIKIRLKFQNEYFLDYFPLSVQENFMFVSIDVNVVLDLKCIRLKYMLETINNTRLILLFSGLKFS